MGFLSQNQLSEIGFKHLGKNVKISSNAVFYNSQAISIGDNTRIDDFCIISAGDGGIEIGCYVHIAAYCSLQGQGTISMKDFSGLSSRVAIYSSTDDYSGNYLTNPTVPSEFKNVISGDVIIEEHVIVGVCAAIMPNVTISKGAAVGAFSLVTKSIEESKIAIGIPAKAIKSRAVNIFNLEARLLNSTK